MLKILHDIPLKAHNTFGIDARADSFAGISSVNDLLELINSKELNIGKFFILGSGSNVLFRTNYDGLVLKIDLKGIEKVSEDVHHVYVKAMAGEEWDRLVAWCMEHGWGGLENLSGIPGSVGAGPIQNIGAYGTELKDHFYELEAMEIKTGQLKKFSLEECGFGYRDSVFKRELKGKFVILSVTLRLEKVPKVNLTYGALRERVEEGKRGKGGDAFSATGHRPPATDESLERGDYRTVNQNIKLVREVVLEIRKEKLPDPAVLGNAGSFFKNPVVSRGTIEKLKERYPGIVYYEFQVPGSRLSPLPLPLPYRGGVRGGVRATVKLSAGWLIEHCGWKGFREGDAGVHKDQALVLVNYGKATGQEILDLARRIQLSVLENFGIQLEPEVNVVD